MKKHALTALGLAVAFVAALGLVSCQGSGNTASQKVELSVLHYAAADQPGYDQEVARWDIVKDKVKDFATIKYEELFNEPYHQKVQAYAASGKLPDVLYMWPSGRSAVLHNKHLVKDLTPLVGADFLKNFLPLAVDPNQQAGKYLGIIPNTVTYTHVLWVNTAILDKLGLKPAATYEELKKQIPVIKKAGLEVILMDNKDQWPMQSCLFSAVAGRLAGNQFIDDVLAGKAKFTDKPFVDSLKFIETLYKDGALSKATLQIGYGDLLNLFASGKAPYYIDGDWRIGNYITEKASGKALIAPEDQKKIILTTFPAIPGQKADAPATSSIVGTGFGISSSIEAGSPKEKAAVEVVKLLAGPEIQLDRLKAGASFPSRTDVTLPADLEPLQQQYGAWIKSVKGGSYVLDGVLDPKVCTPLNVGLQEIGLGTSTAEKVAASMQKALEEWKALAP